jgi:uncharacterized protein YceK
MRRLLMPLLLVSVLLAGCGDDESHTTSGAGTTKETSTKNRSADDAATARKIVLKQADLPSGWTDTTAADAADSGSSDETDRKVAACLGVDPNASDKRGSADSSFEKGESGEQTANASVEMAADKKEVQQELAAVKKSTATDCLKPLLDSQVQEGMGTDGKLDSSTLARDDAAKTFGDGSVVLRYTAQVTASGAHLPVVIDMVVAAKGRAEISLLLSSIGAPTNAALRDDLLAKMVARA